MTIAVLQQNMNGETMGKHLNPALFSGLLGKQSLKPKSLQLRAVCDAFQENTADIGQIDRGRPGKQSGPICGADPRNGAFVKS